MEVNIEGNKQNCKSKYSIDLIRNNSNKDKKKLITKKQKQNHKYLKKKIIINIKSNLLLIFFLIFIILSSGQQKSIKKRVLTETNEITIIIRGGEEQTILSKPELIPDQIYLNDDPTPLSGSLSLTGLEGDINTVKLLYNTPIQTCNGMFYNLNNITEVDCSKFDFSQVTDMSDMFHSCSSLTSIDFSDINTSSLTNMNYMFYGCYALQNLDLSSFNTHSLTSMIQTFFLCTSLQNLDVSSFDTSSVTIMSQTFFQCCQLKSLDLSSFDTSLVETMFQMFINCWELENINLGSNFNTHLVTNMEEMFFNCASLKSLDISNFDTSSVTTMKNMFLLCKELISLDLSSFDTSNINNMEGMFSDCNKLKFIDINSFDTTNVLNMNNMFLRCNSLESLDLRNFNTEKVQNFESIFEGCENLEILDISSSFDTSSANIFKYMFKDCKSLKSLDLSHFVTSSVNDMNGMFLNCNSLTSLELGNFDTSSVTDMTDMFNNCNSLISLNLNSFSKDSLTNSENMLANLRDSLKYCINVDIKSEVEDQITSYIEENCNELCDTDSNKFISEKNKCIKNCIDDDIYVYEYNNICKTTCPTDTYTNNDYKTCHDSVPPGYYLYDEINNILAKCNIKCGTCTYESESNNLCTSCNNNEGYFKKNNDPMNTGLFINCYNEEQIGSGYYIDQGEEMFKICHSNCKKCTEKGNFENNLCTECYNGYSLINNNCYKTSDLSDVNSTSTYSYEMNVDTDLKDVYKNVTYINFKPEDLDFIYKAFNLNKETDKLFILLTDSKSTDLNTATSDYNFRIFLENETELNLSNIKEDLYIDFYVPIKDLDLANFNHSKYFSGQGFDIYNKSSDFYNDFCTPAFQEDNDVTLKDRKKYIYPNNVTLCKENCEYNGIDIENERVICSCNLNQNKSYNNTEDDDFLAEDDGNFFSYLLDNINYKVFQCYKLLLSFNNLKNNYAFYIILGIFFIIIILNFIFGFYTLPNLKKTLVDEIPTKEKIRKETIDELKKFKSRNSIINNPSKKKYKPKKKKSKKILKTFSNNNINTKNHFIKKKDNFMTNANYDEEIISPSIENFESKEEETEKGEEYKDNKDIKDNNQIEDFNELPYTKAIKEDKRNIFKIFGSIIIQKIEIISFFCVKERLKIILINEYILSLLFNFFFNSLLYSDEVVSKKYHNNGQLDFIVTIVLSLLSNIITSIVCFYANYSKGINERSELIMEIKVKKFYLKNLLTFFKYLKIKLIIFFIIEIIIIFTCFYYIVIFCIIYSKSQGSLLTNYLTSLLEGLITSIAISIIILVTRKIGLVCANQYLYNTSKFINNKF